MLKQNGNLGSVAHDIDNKDAIERTQFPVQNEESAMSVSKLKGLSHTDTAGSTSKKMLHSNHGSLVQATISTLFKKAEEKVRSYKALQSTFMFYFFFLLFCFARISKWQSSLFLLFCLYLFEYPWVFFFLVFI